MQLLQSGKMDSVIWRGEMLGIKIENVYVHQRKAVVGDGLENFLAIHMTRRFCLPSISDHILISK